MPGGLAGGALGFLCFGWATEAVAVAAAWWTTYFFGGMAAVLSELCFGWLIAWKIFIFYYLLLLVCVVHIEGHHPERYLAEFKIGVERKEAAESTMNAYKADALVTGKDINPCRFGSDSSHQDWVALNFSGFYYETSNSPDQACNLAKQIEEDKEMDLGLCRM
nr:14-3-3 protein homolog 2-like [Aegilops tauschii subsp. strangulata]